MTEFELTSQNDGHIRALSRAIQVASRISKDAILEFNREGLRLSTNTQEAMVTFKFPYVFFDRYLVDQTKQCFVNLKALQGPFRSYILADRETRFSSIITIKCELEDQLNNRIVFTVSRCSPTMLTYKIPINGIEISRARELRAINNYRKERGVVRLTPAQNTKERFLLSAFNSFAPDMDRVSILVSQTNIKFIGTSSNETPMNSKTSTEFTHPREDFSLYEMIEPDEKVHITLALKLLKVFLNLVEMNKLQALLPEYIFEGTGELAHFKYNSNLLEAHFTASTQDHFIPEDSRLPSEILAITNGPDESFIVDDNINQFTDEADELFNQYDNNDLDIEDDDESNGYHDEQSIDGSQFSNHLDGNLDGLRSEMSERRTYDLAKVREIIDIDLNPKDIENIEIDYSSDESLE